MLEINEVTHIIIKWEEKSVFPFIRISAPHGVYKISIEECQTLLDKIFKEKELIPPTLSSIENDFPPYYDDVTNTIKISEEYLRIAFIIRQSAEILTSPKNNLNSFLKIYIELLDKYLGIKEAALMKTLELHGIVMKDVI